MTYTTSASRFASPELLQLGKPPLLATQDYDTLLSASLAELIKRFNDAKIAYNTEGLETDTAVILTEQGASRDLARRRAIDDAVAQTFLGPATGGMLDQRAADYGVVRRVVQFEDPVLGLPLIMEDDDSLRLRARLAWEALSVAGPAGAYVFHALDAHPGVYDALPIGPETGIVQPGEALVVIQGRAGDGTPSDAIMDVVADRLDAYEVVYSNAVSVIRPVRNGQSVRPIGARVTVAAARALSYTTTATIYVGSYGDAESVRLAAVARLKSYQESRRRIGRIVSDAGMIAALSLADKNGIPVVSDVDLAGGDIVPSHLHIPVPEEPIISVEVR